MNSTRYAWNIDLPAARMAIGYEGNSMENLRPVSPERDQWGARGPGSIVTTIGDLYKWIQALNDDVVLHASSKEKMFTAYVGDEGYGWHVIETSQGRLVRRGGGLPEFESSLRWYLDKDVIIIFAINNHIGFRVPVAKGIEQILFEKQATSK